MFPHPLIAPISRSPLIITTLCFHAVPIQLPLCLIRESTPVVSKKLYGWSGLIVSPWFKILLYSQSTLFWYKVQVSRTDASSFPTLDTLILLQTLSVTAALQWSDAADLQVVMRSCLTAPVWLWMRNLHWIYSFWIVVMSGERQDNIDHRLDWTVNCACQHYCKVTLILMIFQPFLSRLNLD